MNTIQLYIGQVRRLDDEGQSSAIHKDPVSGPIWLGAEGLAGDAQADRRVHGGPEKAVHHYAAENYTRLAERFPAIAAQLLPGSIGENVSMTGWTEDSVHIGDVFRLGKACVQVSQPRSPCWKIDHRYTSQGIAAFIAEVGLTGWYYRVLEQGEVISGARCELLERQSASVSLAEFWQVWRQHRPELDQLARLSTSAGLTPDWKTKLLNRLDWLRANPDQPITPPPTFHVKPTRS